jgi:hypothetical protein
METVFPHPTLSEMMHESVLGAYGSSAREARIAARTARTDAASAAHHFAAKTIMRPRN